MSETTENNLKPNLETDMDTDTVFRISEEFERDARRYNRAFRDEQEVSTR